MKKLLNTLYVTSENSYLGLDGENIVVFEEDKEKGRLPLHNLEGIVSFGYRGVSPALMGSCAEKNISLCFMTPQGKFLARITGKTTAGRTRLRKVAKQCTNYGRRVQNSVFECILDSAQSVALKGILSDIIDKNKDSLRFYYLGNNYQTKIEHVGIERGIPVDQPLIM